jgi:hypothetical protein
LEETRALDTSFPQRLVSIIFNEIKYCNRSGVFTKLELVHGGCKSEVGESTTLDEFKAIVKSLDCIESMSFEINS